MFVNSSFCRYFNYYLKLRNTREASFPSRQVGISGIQHLKFPQIHGFSLSRECRHSSFVIQKCILRNFSYYFNNSKLRRHFAISHLRLPNLQKFRRIRKHGAILPRFICGKEN